MPLWIPWLREILLAFRDDLVVDSVLDLDSSLEGASYPSKSVRRIENIVSGAKSVLQANNTSRKGAGAKVSVINVSLRVNGTDCTIIPQAPIIHFTCITTTKQAFRIWRMNSRRRQHLFDLAHNSEIASTTTLLTPTFQPKL